mgnify:CR=1 FL=1
MRSKWTEAIFNCFLAIVMLGILKKYNYTCLKKIAKDVINKYMCLSAVLGTK